MDDTTGETLEQTRLVNLVLASWADYMSALRKCKETGVGWDELEQLRETRDHLTKQANEAFYESTKR